MSPLYADVFLLTVHIAFILVIDFQVILSLYIQNNYSCGTIKLRPTGPVWEK